MIMKKLLITLITTILLVFSCAPPVEDTSNDTELNSIEYDVTADETTPNKRVVVYIPYWSFDYARTNTLDLDKVSHVNLAFVNPDSNGDFSFPDVSTTAIHSLVDEAHNKGVKVLMSIGGAGATEKYDEWVKPVYVQGFVNKMLNCMFEYQLDGIDVDLEGERITADYNGFIEAIYNTLPDKDMLLTAAVQMYTGGRISTTALTYFDFINPMAYDLTGPWNPGGQHSSYEFAVDNLNYWVNTRGVTASKVCLGVPFYGYNFNVGDGEYISYRDIIKDNPEDLWKQDQTGKTYYNGSTTIAAKTELAQNYGGIMVWEISQDAEAPYSLLDVIDSTMNP